MIKCQLDQDGCIDLHTVLRVVNQINQEQAWAICYELASLMQRLSPANCAPIDSLAQIKLHKDGHLHDKTCKVAASKQKTKLTKSNETTTNQTLNTAAAAKTTTTTTTTITTKSKSTALPEALKGTQPQDLAAPAPPTPPITPELNEDLEGEDDDGAARHRHHNDLMHQRKRPAIDEGELVNSLGIALFWALDYGIPDDEERKLSIAMEYLILQSQSKLTLDEVIEVCIKRLNLPTKTQADLHYKDVCRRLIGDTIELSIFLEKIYTASMVLSDITLDNCLEQATHRGKLGQCDIGDEDDLSGLGEPLASLRALRINDWARLWMQVIRELRQRAF